MSHQTRVPAEEAITFLEFELSDPGYPFVGISQDGGRVLLQEIIPRGDGTYGEFYSIWGVDPDAVLETAAARGSVDAELLVAYDDGGLFEFVVSANCPAVFLGEEGTLPRKVDSVDGHGRIEAEVPPSVDASGVVERFMEAHPDAELVTKREQPYTTPLFTHRELERGMAERLTERQQEVLLAAHEAGYYEWPRETCGEELAAQLGISAPTFQQHLRAAEQKLIELVFESTISDTQTGGVT